MRTIFRQELTEIGDELLALGSLVATAVDKAGRSLANADLQLAEEVIAGDREIDQLESRIESSCLTMLALQQPVATDLRVVVAALRMSATLERMGDLARHVAFAARGAYPNHVATGPLFDTLVKMAEHATELVRKLVVLMDDHNLELVTEIDTQDNELDALLRDTFDLLIRQQVDASRQQVVDAVLLSRFLERLGDHSLSGAKRVAYLVTGDLDASALISPTEPDVD